MQTEMILPLEKNCLCSTENVRDATAVATRVMGNHRVSSLKQVDAKIHIHELSLAQSRLCYMRYGSAVHLEVSAAIGHFRIIVPVAGNFGVNLNGKNFVVPAGSYAVFNPHDRPNVYLDGDGDFISFSVPRARMLERLGALTQDTPRRQPEFDHRSEAGGNSVAALMQDVVHQIDNNATRAPGILVARGYEELLLSSLILTHSHSKSRSLNTNAGFSSPEMTRKAAAILADDPAQPFDLSALSQQVGVSPRSLELGFRSQFGTTPSTYHRNLRLEFARTLIEDNYQSSSSVLDIATAVGYSNPGRFARAFSSRFGMFPSEMIRSQQFPGR